MSGDQPCQPLVRLRRRVSRAFQLRRVGLLFLGTDQRPQLHPAGRVLAAGQVDHVARIGEAARRLVLAEHPVDRIEHGRRRAEGDIEVDRHEALVGHAAALGEPFAHLLELARIGALEAEDRLLDVADGEHRACAFDRALADEELLGQAADHLPLVGVGVLRLVDQHVVDAAVELVEHPGGAVGALQQPARGDDQVVVVQCGAPLLGAGVAPGDVEAEPQQRQRALDQGGAGDAIEHRGQTLGLLAQHVLDVGHGHGRGLAREPFQDRALVGEEHLAVRSQPLRPALRIGQPLGNQRGARDVGLAAPGQGPCGRGQGRRIECRFETGTARQFARRVVGRAAQLARQPLAQASQPGLVADARQQPGPFAEQLGHQLGILGDRDPAGDGSERVGQIGRRVRPCQRLHLLVLGVAQQRLRVALVQHLEARRDARLQREALEQRLAEGVDGQDVDAARRVEHAREQAAGDDALGRFGRAVDQLGDLLVELGVRRSWPSGRAGRPAGCASRPRRPW